jgi:hypothetical protein
LPWRSVTPQGLPAQGERAPQFYRASPDFDGMSGPNHNRATTGATVASIRLTAPSVTASTSIFAVVGQFEISLS